MRGFDRPIENDYGFTLMELLIVVVIIALLATIAIPQFLGQRERAWEAAAESDVRGAVLAEQGYVTDNSGFTSLEADLVGHGFVNSPDVDFWIDASTNATRFQVHAQHCNGGEQFRYVSDGAATIERIARAARVC